MTLTIIRKPPASVTIVRRTPEATTVTTVGGTTGPRGARGHGSFATLSDVDDWSTAVEGDVPIVGADGFLRPGPQTGGGGSGVPDGGTTDQALLKDSNANGDADWRTLTPTLVGADPAGAAAAEAAARAAADTALATSVSGAISALDAAKVDDVDGHHDGVLELEAEAGENTVLATPDRRVVLKWVEGVAGGLALLVSADPIGDGDDVSIVDGAVLQLEADNASLATSDHAVQIDATGVKVDNVLLADLFEAAGAVTAHVGQADPHPQYQKESERNAANGYAPLDAAGLLPTANLPPLAITSVQVAANQAAMLALTAEPGDVAQRTDTGTFFILTASPASTLGNWVELTAPGAVVTVDGRSGVVTLSDLYDAIGSATSAVSAHVAAVDPHADRAFTTSAVATHVAASDPHGDRAFATAADAVIAGTVTAEASARSTADLLRFRKDNTSDDLGTDPTGELKAATRRYADAGASRSTAGLLQKLAQEVGDANIVWVGNSIDVDWAASYVEASQQVGAYIGAQFPRYTVKTAYYDGSTDTYGSETTLASGAGASTVHLWMAAVSGTRLDYWTGARLPLAVTAKTPDLIVIAHTINEGPIDATQTYEQVRSRMAAGLDAVASANEGVPILVLGQHKRFGDTTQELKARACAEICATRGYGFVDLCKAFIDDGRTIYSGVPLTPTDLTIDGTHLSQIGHDLEAATLKPLFAKVGPQLQPLGLPTLQGGLITNLVKNGLFQDWTIANRVLTTGVTTNTSTTISTTGSSHIGLVDTGAPISGTNIPAGATIVSVNTATHEATISAAATGSGTGISFTIGVAPPATWLQTNATLSKDTTNPPNGQTYGVRVQAATAAATSIRQTVLDAETVKAVRGKYVSVSVVMRVANTQTGANIGKIRLADGVNTKDSLVSTVGPFDAYAARTLTMKVDAAATSLTLTVFADSAANASADITIGQVTAVIGMLPRDIQSVVSVDVTGRLTVKGTASISRNGVATYGRFDIGSPTSIFGVVFDWPIVSKYYHLAGAFPFREDGYAGSSFGNGNVPADFLWPLVVGAAVSIGTAGYNVTWGSDWHTGRIKKRVNTVASSATPTINTDTTDHFRITALAADITSFSASTDSPAGNLTGTPLDGDELRITITDNGTPRALVFGPKFAGTPRFPLPVITVASTRLYLLFIWSTVTSKWELQLCSERTPRYKTTAAPGGTPSINTDAVDHADFTGLAAAVTSMTTNLTGTPVAGQRLLVSFTDNGTARAITWGASFVGSGLNPLPATTALTAVSTQIFVQLVYTGAAWKCIGVS